MFSTREHGAEVCRLVVSIQRHEKEKLTLVAARHLDMLQDSLGSLGALTGGKSQQQIDYLRTKVAETEEAISEALQELQALKCDLA